MGQSISLHKITADANNKIFAIFIRESVKGFSGSKEERLVEYFLGTGVEAHTRIQELNNKLPRLNTVHVDYCMDVVQSVNFASES